MLPTFSFPFQPYYFLPPFMTQGNSVIYQNPNPFLIQTLLPQNAFNRPNSKESSSNALSTSSLPQIRPFYKLQNLNPPQNQVVQKSHNNTNKEKAAKKPANRPTTYLTQKKFYLSQALPTQDNSQRILRVRTQKKKIHKAKYNTSLPRQTNEALSRPQAQKLKSAEVTLNEEMTHSKEKPSEFAALKEEDLAEPHICSQQPDKQRADAQPAQK